MCLYLHTVIYYILGTCNNIVNSLVAGKNKMFLKIYFLVTPNYEFVAHKNINRLRIFGKQKYLYTIHGPAFLNNIFGHNIKRVKFKYLF